MSRFSELIHRYFDNPNESGERKTAAQLLMSHLGDSYQEIEQLAQKVVVAMQHADLDRDGVLDKREILVAVIQGAAKAAGHELPAWLVNWFVEELVSRVKLPDYRVPVPGKQTNEA